MSKEIFMYDEKYNNFKAIINNIEFSISHIPTDTELKYVETLSKEFQNNSIKIAKYLLEDEGFKQFFDCNNITDTELIERLEMPTIRILGNNEAAISYCNHRLDKEHIISFEILGIFEKFAYLSIDG